MVSNTVIRQNSYYDSVTLMSLSSKITDLEGIEDAVISMGTDMNKELLQNVGLDTEESMNSKGSDLIIAIKADNQESYEKAYKKVDELLNYKNSDNGEREKKNPKTISDAINRIEEANMVVISVPGEYAAREVDKALDNNLHVMLFSDNVSIEDEVRLKKKARDKGLLVMGPDCGTASINNTGLCFANKVNEGNIGLVAASGTGLQEVMVQIDRLGGGISQAIGTGGRDLKEEVGGIMMLESINALEKDNSTDVIVLISKPPAKSVEKKILERVSEIDTPVVVSFIEGDSKEVEKVGATFGYNLYDTAKKAVELSDKNKKIDTNENSNELKQQIIDGKEKLKDGQKYVRGLYGGGTLCAESLSILRDKLDGIKSNVAKGDEEKLENVEDYLGNVLLDLGEDEFTQGRPHPMIDPTIRLSKIKKEVKDESVGVILLDFELGYGSHENPVGATLPAIEEAKQIAKDNNREVIFVAYICGTDKDKQNLDKQTKMLKDVGVIVADSNVQAANTVAEILA